MKHNFCLLNVAKTLVCLMSVFCLIVMANFTVMNYVGAICGSNENYDCHQILEDCDCCSSSDLSLQNDESDDGHTHKCDTPADCLHKQICEICGNEFGEYGEHNVVVDKEVRATCVSFGKTMGKHCSICGEVLIEQKVTQKTPHTDLNKDNKCDICGNKIGEVTNQDVEMVDDELPTKNIVLIVVSVVALIVVAGLMITLISISTNQKKEN